MPSQDDVEEFAALLRRLKARTDRSYGALARRLNMNTSTLHRYCAGDAVPLDFAPVERFAAMCGASPAERVELHRWWVLAVAARQRSRPSAGAVSATTTAPGPAADEAAEPVTVTAADATPAVAADPSPGEDRPGPPEPPAEGPTGCPSPERAEAPRPAPREPWYRRRVAVTTAVATALLVTLGSLSALAVSGHSATAGDKRASGTPTAKTAGARHGSPAPSAPPSTANGRSSGSPSPKTPATGDGSPSPSASPSGTTASAAPPLTWTANSQLWQIGCSHDYVIDKTPQQVPPPPAPQDAAPWARTQAAVHGGETLVGISVQGRTDTAVVLEALRVRVVGRAAPVKGTVYAMDRGCGGDMTPRSFTVDLDMDRPIARSVPGSDSATGTSTPAMRMPYRVSAKDPEVLMVDARTVGCDCRWYLELDWSSQGRTGTERIDDHGLPFRTSGTKGLPHYWYANRGWAPFTR
ncbi:helix-turn-helix domain-containing protein [Streptomyces phaeofaciens]|uniref:helix-turn-helix domain-containing protein n=1 Tax=Streptomyces phaeofaciens TaxID=68254 RepID=UPI003697A0D1